ncbi:hypothetical protein [Sulfuriroseicoccus oceanibius]|uniref:Uncharacterized protein n=1 Tax=Sulfuriroseicoccus oceanibius TaxID=2707525 RepID=A0A6B3LA51_9BACT|nr:hypothetical protein [Sulfuriroseicoccus oceanibius]QQL45612.1 hypothetical protein G3M56_003210 [Sulfuriroseicoccus oceanibius]
MIPPPPGRPSRPQRPQWDERWNGRDQKFTTVNKNWYVDNRTTINRFEVNRANEWKSVRYHWQGRDWRKHWGGPEYRRWRHDVWGYRGNRCRQIWQRTAHFHYHNHFFNRHWWGTCWWHRRPVVYHHYSPWWWWRPLTWGSVGYFWGSSIQSQPVIYDPGTTVVYQGDTIYINGNAAGNADDYRRETIALANPELDEIPVPTPPEEVSEADVKPDQPQGDWLPVGVWALTQQEQGDATMFFQMSIDKEGIVAGAYKNVMTGDEQPIVGRLDFESQRIAWHVGEVTTTVYETGLSQLENDVASVFVHFGETQTQTWLMVRMPSPEMPPGTVKLPDVPKE